VTTSRPRERGIALLLVLWIFMVLGVLALDFARYMRDDAMAAINLADETRGYYLALAGMNRAIYDAERLRERDAAGRAAGTGAAGVPSIDLDPDAEDQPLVPPDGEWHEGEFAGGRWRVRMTDEAGRIALNKAEEPLLTRVVRNLMLGGDPTAGVDRRTENQIETVVDSILDWRDHDRDMTRPHGAESDFYMKRRPPYHAKNGFFDSPEELLLVRGVTPALFYGTEGVPGLKDVFSVYSRTGRLNLNTAPPAVLQVLLGNDAAADLLEQRANGVTIVELVKAQLVAIDPSLESLIEPQAPRIVRLEAEADMSEARNQSHVAAIADLAADTGEGMRIIRWLDRAPFNGPFPTLPSGSEDDA
jgi:general secretion pathway protein K